MASTQADGGPSPVSRRVKISIPEHYKETSQEVWEELERYIFDGFLITTSFLLGRTYVFKTLNHTEIRNMEFLKPMKTSPPEIRAAFRSAFISHSVFMIDGTNALYERPRHINRLTKIISKMDPSIQEKIVENLSVLNERSSRLYPLVEVYVQENRSRFKWLQLESIPVHSPMATGIQGTDELGMNYCQQTWTALNRMLDKRETMEREWSNAKFIGSCFNGKGVRAIDERDRSRHATELSEKEDLKMKILYRYLNRNAAADDVPEETITLPDGRTAVVDKKFQAISAVELRDQLEAQLSGEKDYHDLVVEARQKQLHARALELEKHKRNIYAAPIITPPGTGLAGSTATSGSRVLGGKAEVDAYLSRMQALRIDAARKAQEAMQESDETSDRGGDQSPYRNT